MILIADSGSTKTTWYLTGENSVEGKMFYTLGYNPHFIHTEEIIQSLNDTLIPDLGADVAHKIEEIYFYGAGCSTERDCAIVINAIKAVFPNSHAEVDHDLLGAARALCGREAGVACILGTGSNSCLYDGEFITDNVTALGFTLGDEGGGAELGRRLLKAYFYREFPNDLKRFFDEKYHLTKDSLLENLYSKPLPNRFVASFSAFCGDNKSHPFIQQLIKSNFRDYVTRQVCKYEGVERLPIHFVGSVAHYFMEELREVLAEQNLTLGQVIRNPIFRLVEFHTGVEVPS